MSHSIRIKEGVKLADLKPQTVLAMIICDQVFEKYGKYLFITSGNDSTHMKDSKHYTGEAFDARSRFFTPDEIPHITDDLAEALGENYDVVYEKDHFHIEYDPK